jgi:feruloyl esterase
LDISFSVFVWLVILGIYIIGRGFMHIKYPKGRGISLPKVSRKSLLASIVAALFVGATFTTTLVSAVAPSPSYVDKSIKPTVACASLATTAITDTTDNVAFTVDGAVSTPGDATVPASCRVQVSATHPPAGDDVNIWIWLPTNGWNGRFQGTGGGGYVGGSQDNLVQPLKDGYVGGATDAGHTVGGGSYALNPDGTLNWQLVEDNIVGVHEMTVAGKALTNAFYSKKAQYAYFTGCSAGTRQGITEAQRYPQDYDGVVGGSPAINVTEQRVAGLWGQLVMLQANDFLPQCKLDAATTAAVAACDNLDKVADGVINDPEQCKYDPQALVGTVTPCGTITQTDATVIKKMWGGARDSQGNFMWYGLARGASLSSLNNTGLVNGQLDGKPSSLMTDWVKYFLTQHPNWDWHTLTQAQFEQLFTQSEHEFGYILGDNPDLNDFRQAGGKMLLWQGQSDQLLAPQGATSYYNKVAGELNGPQKVQDFARLFMAPGVGHCGGGAGPQPTGLLPALVKWVEHDNAPDTLLAEKTDAQGDVIQTRPLCTYPKTAVYEGHGHDTNKASSFDCEKV